MLGAFAYLTATSARNRFVRQLRRLRSPRYVIALLFAVAYFGLVFVNPSSQGGAAGGVLIPTVETVVALTLMGLVVYWWVIGSDTSALAFSPAELQFLFPAPVTRRQLIQFKLIRAQLVILLNILIWSLLLRRGAGEGALAWVRPMSLWVLLSTMQLHRLGATLARTSAAEHGGAGLRRSGTAMAVMALVVGAVAYSFVRAWPAAGLTLETVRPTLEAATGGPPASWALAPVRLVLAPLFAADMEAWARAIPFAVALMLLHFVWVVRADAAFEDAAIEASAQVAARAAARRSGGPSAGRRGAGTTGRRRLPLRPIGDPVVAILWKNMLAVTRGDRFFRQILLFGLAVLGMTVVAYLRPERTASFVLGIIAAWGLMLVLLGPLWLRNDLRGDLPRLELLRTYPLPPARTVAAEIASSALVLTLLELALGVAVFVVLLRAPDVDFPLEDRVALATAAALALPAVNLLSAAIHNASVLLFPAWLPLGGDRKPGFEAMGQMYLTLIASVILLALLLALPVLVGAIAAYAFAPGYGAWRLVPAVVTGSLVAAGELALIIHWLGGVYARTEPGDVVGA